MSSSQVQQLSVVNAQTLKSDWEQRSVVLIDVREAAEFAREHIPGAILNPLSQFDSCKIPQAAEMPVVVYCQSGHRSAIAAQKLRDAGFSSVTQLAQGITGWKAAGFPTVVNRNAPISLGRQVQLVTGSLVLLGTGLGALVSPGWLLLSGFVGAGILFSGITNTCVLGAALAKLPYNQRSQG